MHRRYIKSGYQTVIIVIRESIETIDNYVNLYTWVCRRQYKFDLPFANQCL